jgi:hypothetical protein
VHWFPFVASISAYSVIQHPKWDVLFGDCLEFEVQDGVLRLEQNHGICPNWVEGKFGWLDFCQGDSFSEQPTGEVGGEMFG